MSVRKRLPGLLHFTRRETHAALTLLPLLFVLGWIVHEASRPVPAPLPAAPAVNSNDPHSGTTTVATDGTKPRSDTVGPFVFDPNTVTYEELRALGFSKRDAAGLVKYRAKGKVFEIPEDFAASFNVSDSMYARLKPYIVIGESYALKPAPRHEPSSAATDRPISPPKSVPLDTLAPFDPNALDAAGFTTLGFTSRQAETIVRYRKARGGFDTPEALAACRAVSDEAYERLRPYIRIAPTAVPLLELNAADSAQLDALYGIGAKSAAAIVAYRERLGGYHDAAQLAELPVITERNWERIVTQIRIDSCKIRKIDINFAPVYQFREHPYMTPALVRRILKHRQRKGGWHNIREMTEDHTLTAEQAERLAPYLRFGTQ